MQYYPSEVPWNQQSGASEHPFRYNGKEFVEQFTLDEYDSKARWYYPSIMRTTTMDPLCEKYYDTSPYAWCGNNTSNNVDDWGESYYTIDNNGNITLYKSNDDIFDNLYTMNDNGTINWNNYLTLYDQSLLSDLTKERKDYSGHYSLTSSSEVGNLFIFASNNTNVEWGLTGFLHDGKRKYIIGTSHKKDRVSQRIDLQGIKENNMIFDIHSHPSVDGTKGGSGYYKYNETPIPNSDIWNIRMMYQRYNYDIKRLPPHYVYHRYSNNLYQYTPYAWNIYIKRINNVNGLKFLIP